MLRDPHGRVPEDHLHRPHLHPEGEQESGGGVTKVMDTDGGEASFFKDRLVRSRVHAITEAWSTPTRVANSRFEMPCSARALFSHSWKVI